MQKLPEAPLEVFVFGAGQRVIFVHGSHNDASTSWTEQRSLSARWQVEFVNRRGFGGSPPPLPRQDFEQDGRDIARLLGEGAHLVGQSYGAISVLFAAALRPDAVRSLTINEPPAYGLLKGNAVVDAMAADIQRARHAFDEPRAFLQAFNKVVAGPQAPAAPPLPDPLPPALEQGVRVSMAGRDPAEAILPLEALARASFPKLVTSGGNHPVFEAICDKIAEELKAERSIIPGAGHNVPRTGAPFNNRLEDFLTRADIALARIEAKRAT